MAGGWKKPLLFGCFGLPLLICALGGGFLCTTVNRIGSNLPQEIAKLKGMGIATEPADLNPKPKVADAENAASLYRSLGYQIEAIEADKSKAEVIKLLDTFGISDNADADLGRILREIQAHQGLFADIDKLAGKPRVDFQRDYSKGIMVLFPEFADMKRIAKWQCGRARAQWMTGNRHAAIDSLRTAYRTAEHAAEEPNILGCLVPIAISAICHRVLDRFITDARNDASTLKQLAEMLSNVRDRADMRKALEGEFVLGMATLENLEPKLFANIAQLYEGKTTASPAWLDTLMSNPRIRKMYTAKFAEAWRLTFEQIPSDREDWTGFQEAVESRTKAIESDRSLDNIFNQIMFPILDQAVWAAAKQVAERRTELVSLKLLLARRKGLPADLSMYGQLGIDPFTSKQLGYRREGKGFKVWSVGMDRVDQGGVGRAPGGEGWKGIDIVMGFDIHIPKVKPSN
jgi:hypothetical protein